MRDLTLALAAGDESTGHEGHTVGFRADAIIRTTTAYCETELHAVSKGCVLMTQGNLRYGNTNNDEVNDPTVLKGTVSEDLASRRAAFTVHNRPGNHPRAGGAIVGVVGPDPNDVSNDAAAVEGFNDDGDGVLGTSGAHSGVHGIGPNGVFGEAPQGSGQYGAGVAAANEGLGMGLVAFAARGAAGVFYGDVFVTGQLWVQAPGGKHSVVRGPDGTNRLMYCLEGTEAWLEDFGRDRLSDGRARVNLDADYAAAVETFDYFVFLSPEGESRGLYVADRSETGFVVQEADDGQGTTPFSYRVVARPKGGDKQRLATLSDNDLPPLEYMPREGRIEA